jgi:hypothetical protein
MTGPQGQTAVTSDKKIRSARPWWQGWLALADSTSHASSPVIAGAFKKHSKQIGRPAWFDTVEHFGVAKLLFHLRQSVETFFAAQ